MAAQISTHPAERTTALPLVRTNAGVLSAPPAWLSLALVPCVMLAAGIGLLVPIPLERSMPGDDRVQRPTFNATRAVTVAATP